jgi:hypothetical protein
VGNDGETLVADSSTSTGLRWQQGGLATGKNSIINGFFDIWQRGTSFAASAAASIYTADRWMFNRSGLTTGATLSRQASTALASTYAARVQRDSGNTSTANMTLWYNLESADSYQYQGKTVTLSFAMKKGANFSAPVVDATIFTGTGTDQNVNTSGFTGSTALANVAVVPTTNFVRYSVTGTVASNATQLAILFNTGPTGTAGANDWYEVTGVQLEISNVATNATRSSTTIQGELAACQRYYYRQTAAGITEPYAFGSTYNATGGYVFTAVPATMRIKPSSIEFSNVQISDWINNFASTPTIAFCVNNQVWLNFGGSGMTGNRPYVLNASSATSYLAFNAEL